MLLTTTTKENKYKNNQIYNILLDYGYMENDVIDFLDNRTYLIYENCTNMLQVTEKILKYNNKSVDNIYAYMEYLFQNPNYDFIFEDGNCIQLFY